MGNFKLFDYSDLDDFQRRVTDRRNDRSIVVNGSAGNDFFIDYSDLDDFQRRVIDRRNDRSIVVSGSAGSGKSVIALQKAMMIDLQGDNYAVIVYTKSLHKYFADGLKIFKLKKMGSKSLDFENVYYFHQWKKNPTYVKYLIVDECQDFTHEEIEVLKRYGKYFLFFGDTAQSIMNFNGRKPQSVKRTALDMDISPDELYYNYRLTKQIAALGESIRGWAANDLVSKCKRDGEKPNLIKAESYDEQLDMVIEIIKNRSLTSIGILLPFNGKRKKNDEWSVEYVEDYMNNKGIKCEAKYDVEESGSEKQKMELDFLSYNPKIMTWWCAKGLQFKDVFILGCDKHISDEKRNALYVAITRSSERLYLCCSSGLSSIFPPEKYNLYNITINKVEDLI